jgi:hypothetical protein
MTRPKFKQSLVMMGRRTAILLLAVLLSFASVLNILQPETASAAQLTPRKVTISTSRAAATGVSYEFNFRLLTAIDVEGIIFEYCTTPLGTCTKPPGLDVTAATAGVSATQTFSQATAFAEVASTTGDCVLTGVAATETRYCVNRTEAGNEAIGADKVITLTGITNPTLASTFLTVFVRMTLYDNSTFSNSGGAGNQIVHYGTVAAAIVRQLTTTGRVQERLEFCVGAIDDTASTVFATGCSSGGFPSTTTVDLGVIDNQSVVASPVDVTTTNNANDDYGILLVNTNASAGVAVTYFPEVTTSVLSGDTDQLRSFRVVPTDCNAVDTTLTDQCFVSADHTQATGEIIVAGTEKFGLAVACFNTDNGITDNFDPANGGVWDGTYDGDGDDEDTGGDDCENETTAAYSWGFRDDGTPDELIHSTSVVDDEIIKLRFGATAQTTTPTGTYLVITTYVATPTY